MNANATPSSATGAKPGKADENTLKLVEELKTLAVEVLGRGIERMFDGADDMLFEMARRANNNKDQRVYFDTMRVVRLGRPKIGRIFRDEIAAGFTPEAPEHEKVRAADVAFEEMSLQESKALEESIAVSSMASKAEGLYNQLLFELNRRFDWLIKDMNAPLSPTALAPATISNAFRRSAEALDVEFDIEIVIFKLFDRLVISDLGELYTRALRFFDQRGVRAAQIGGGGPGGGARAGGGGGYMGGGSGGPPDMGPGDAAPGPGYGGAPGGAPNGYGFASPPMMDAATLNALRQMSAAAAAAAPLGGMGAIPSLPMGAMSMPMTSYGDMQLGADLVAAAQGQVVPGWESQRAYAYVQRSGVVGRMFNDLLDDPTLPAPLKPRFDQLRFAVIKNALRDTSFFTDKQHPVRGLMSELTTMAAAARASGMDALKRIEDMVSQIQSQFDVAADSIRSQTALPGPVDERTLEEFFEQQKEEARNRRQAIIEKTRRIVAEELQLQTLSRKLPDSMWPLLNSGWAPLMALRLLKQGPDSEAWQKGLRLLRELLDTVDPRRPDMRGDSVVRTLTAEIDGQLREIGMLPERVMALIRSWREAMATVETEVISAPALKAGETAPAKAVDPVPAPLLDEIPFGDAAPASAPAPAVAAAETPAPVRAPAPAPAVAAASPVRVAPAAAATVAAAAEPESSKPTDAVTLMDLLMVLSSWFRVFDHARAQNRWLKVVAHHPLQGTVTFAEFNGQNKLEMSTQLFLDDLVAGRAEPIDLGPAARRALESYLAARRVEPVPA